jgi:prepilin-type processing-associated H-X9-DG protein
MNRPPFRSGFTFAELLAVIVILVLLLATFIPYALNVRETNRRIRCVDNLRTIQWALTAYSARNAVDQIQPLPRTRFDPNVGNGWTAFTGADDPNPFADGSAVEGNDVSASLWLLIREELLPDARHFVCPSSRGEADAMHDAAGRRNAGARTRSNFRRPENLTYGFATPFSSSPDYRLSDTLPGRFALMADIGPAGTVWTDANIREARSPNHHGKSMQVLYADGSVVTVGGPYVGVGHDQDKPGDNIFTALSSDILAEKLPHDGKGVWGKQIGPAYVYDSYLVPADDFAQ